MGPVSSRSVVAHGPARDPRGGRTVAAGFAEIAVPAAARPGLHLHGEGLAVGQSAAGAEFFEHCLERDFGDAAMKMSLRISSV